MPRCRSRCGWPRDRGTRAARHCSPPLQSARGRLSRLRPDRCRATGRRRRAEVERVPGLHRRLRRGDGFRRGAADRRCAAFGDRQRTRRLPDARARRRAGAGLRTVAGGAPRLGDEGPAARPGGDGPAWTEPPSRAPQGRRCPLGEPRRGPGARRRDHAAADGPRLRTGASLRRGARHRRLRPALRPGHARGPRRDRRARRGSRCRTARAPARRRPIVSARSPRHCAWA